MAIKQKTIEVNGSEYLITQLGALKGTRVLKEITKLVGPAFAQMQKKDGDGESGTIGDALGILFENLDNANIEGMIMELANTVAKSNGSAINFDMEFAGEYDKLFLVLKEVAEFNFGSVFTLFGSRE
jgi:hypothetical protein